MWRKRAAADATWCVSTPPSRPDILTWSVTRISGLLSVFLAAALATESNVPARESSKAVVEMQARSRAREAQNSRSGHSSLYSAICCSSFSISALSSLLYLKREKFVSWL